MITKEEFANRRKKLLTQLPANSIAIIHSAPQAFRNNDTEYLYRQNSDFYYLTGFNEPDAAAVFIPNRSEGEFILFNRVKDPSKEVWTGAYAGQEGAVADFGANQSFPINELDAQLEKLSKDREPCLNVADLIHELRLIKSEAEINLMREAAQISAKAHIRAMKACRAGLHEYHLQAEIEHEFKIHGCAAPAYGSIVGSGENACTLHYVDNNAVLSQGDLVLIDAACEHHYYAADITRTFPVDGKFTLEQKQVYELVLSTQLAVIDLIKPGLAYETLQAMACSLITEGLVKLGLLKGKLGDLIEQKAYKVFYMHNIGHWIGMDVHDVGKYQLDGKSRLLEAGMVLTVEPGIYIAVDNLNVDAKWRGIGVRIEDDILVMPAGHEVLSAGAPKSVEDICSVMVG